MLVLEDSVRQVVKAQEGVPILEVVIPTEEAQKGTPQEGTVILEVVIL